ncbi:MAG TPA: hypothetical protein VNP89_07320 [Gaiellaceae bacterium]|nr:hypothetical protein [Gaiellaceae bacterium]
MRLAWDDPSWLADATAWIDQHVLRTGDVELMLARPWSAVVRVPTAGGDVWFKEDPPALAFEPALTELLARRQPELLPEVIAADGPRLLTRDAGRRLRAQLDDGMPAPSWPKLLALFAELQIELADAVPQALALGTPDVRPELLGELSAKLPGGHARAERVRRAVDGLGDAVEPTVVHTEAHDGNLFVRDGHVRLLDWAEAVVSHPFVGMVLPLRFAAERTGASPGSVEVERLRDAYLEPFTRAAPLSELRDAFAHGYLLGTLVRAITWDALAAPRDVAIALGDPVPAWLGLFDGVAAGTTTLGDA